MNRLNALLSNIETAIAGVSAAIDENDPHRSAAWAHEITVIGEALQDEAVYEMRLAGRTWEDVALAVGMESRQAAHRRWQYVEVLREARS